MTIITNAVAGSHKCSMMNRAVMSRMNLNLTDNVDRGALMTCNLDISNIIYDLTA
jgi:hypothetical protein